MKKFTLVVAISCFLITFGFLVWRLSSNKQALVPTISEDKIAPESTPTPTLPETPTSYTIPIRLHVFQTFNNCGPASLSMQLSYFDINISQQEIGQKLRPYQNPAGDNDDKSVTLEELAKEAENYGLTPFHRPNGSVNILKKFIASNLPVVVRTWTKPGEDIGHYRVVRGYDDRTGEIIQDDSLQDKNLRFTYDYLLSIWQPFNFEYLVIVPQDKINIAKEILGEDVDQRVAWQKARKNLTALLNKDPNNLHNLFNMSVTEHNLGNYDESVKYFEQVERLLPFRTLWYQIEPIQAYQKLKQYDKVFELTEKILNNHNRAFSELYQIRAEVYLSQGNKDAARRELELAIYYNKNFKPAQEALEKI
jgi:tetratricopeptide (TPR) repeat protein